MIRRLSERAPPAAPQTERGVLGFCREMERWARQLSVDVIGQLNSQVQGVGEEISSAGTNVTIKPTHAIHVVSGTGSILRILPPAEQYGVEADQTTARSVSSFTGPLFLLPTGAWTLVSGASGVGGVTKNSTAVVGQLMIVVFDGDTWAPSY